MGWTDRKPASAMRGLLLAAFLEATPGVPPGRSLAGPWPGSGHVALRAGLRAPAECEVLTLGTHNSPSAARFLPVSEAPFPFLWWPKPVPLLF